MIVWLVTVTYVTITCDFILYPLSKFKKMKSKNKIKGIK